MSVIAALQKHSFNSPEFADRFVGVCSAIGLVLLVAAHALS